MTTRSAEARGRMSLEHSLPRRRPLIAGALAIFVGVSALAAVAPHADAAWHPWSGATYAGKGLDMTVTANGKKAEIFLTRKASGCPDRAGGFGRGRINQRGKLKAKLKPEYSGTIDPGPGALKGRFSADGTRFKGRLRQRFHSTYEWLRCTAKVRVTAKMKGKPNLLNPADAGTYSGQTEQGLPLGFQLVFDPDSGGGRIEKMAFEADLGCGWPAPLRTEFSGLEGRVGRYGEGRVRFGSWENDDPLVIDITPFVMNGRANGSIEVDGTFNASGEPVTWEEDWSADSCFASFNFDAKLE